MSMQAEDRERVADTREFELDCDVAPSDGEWAVVIQWSAREPERVGEVALLGDEPADWILGRNPIDEGGAAGTTSGGSASTSDGAERPVAFFRQRPPGIDGGTHPGAGS